MRISEFDVASLNAPEALRGDGCSAPYAALIATAGYEARAADVLLAAEPRVFSRVWAYDYSHNQVLSYSRNRKLYEERGEVHSEPESSYRKHLFELVRQRYGESTAAFSDLGLDVAVRYAVDISSMDRDRLARTVAVFAEDLQRPVEVDFFYSLAKYVEPSSRTNARVVVNRAVEGLEGWTADPGLPLICLVGCGFENRLALAALETLEPTETIWLMPRGRQREYDDVVLERNRLAYAESQRSVYEYRVDKPYETLLDLEATVASLIRSHRAVIVPLGPKIFALSAILTGLAHDTNVTVWRLSADLERMAEDREGSGVVVGIRVRFNQDRELSA